MNKPRAKKYKESLFDDHDTMKGDAEEIEKYLPINVIKAPLSVLWYNYNFKFKDKYPAKFHPDFVRDMIEVYTKPGDVVYDAFGGAGIVPRTAIELGRKGVYTDVNPKAVDLARLHACEESNGKGLYFKADARTFDFEKEQLGKANLVLSSPPFGLNIQGDKNNYSTEPNDLSNCESYPEFFREMAKIIKNIYYNTAPNGFLILDSKDRTKDGIFQPLSIRFFNIAERVGFKPVTRYTIYMMPSRVWGTKIKPTDFLMSVPTAFDVVVMQKPEMERLV